MRTANRAAGTILGEDIESRVGAPLASVGVEAASLARQFADACQQRIARGQLEWREQFMFQTGAGRRILMCACTPLPAEGAAPGGYVLVFDDITVMLQAQREAAWGEVARRLAHEIKNPLTPIRLSAERMRHKLLPAMTDPKDAQMLERSTETIVQQVEAMKEMVNAFSEYARAPRLEMATVDLNQLVTRGQRPVSRPGSDPRCPAHASMLDPAIDGGGGRPRPPATIAPQPAHERRRGARGPGRRRDRGLDAPGEPRRGRGRARSPSRTTVRASSGNCSGRCSTLT